MKNINSLINYIDKYYDNPKMMDRIREKFPDYIRFCNENDINILINRMMDLDETRDIIYDNTEIISERFGIDAILHIAKKMEFKEGFYFVREMVESRYYTINKYLEYLQNIGELDYIIDNMEEIINFINIDSDSGSEVLKELKKIDEERFKESYPIIIGKMASQNEKYWDKKFLDSLTMIINEIAQNEKTDLSNLEYVNGGSFSEVYRIGNKVIKFGRKRVTDKIPYHRRVLQPLLRRRVDTGNGNLYIEISEYIKRDNLDLEEKEIYQIYKELRNDGIIWVDARKDNLGRLEKDNIAYFNTWLNVKNESVGYIPETIEKDKPLQEGDFVIIDTDLLFREEEFNEEILEKMSINSYYYEKFEERYQNEKRKERLKNKKDEIVDSCKLDEFLKIPPLQKYAYNKEEDLEER